MRSARLLAGSTLALGLVLGACNSDEVTNEVEHSPDAITFIVNGDTLASDTLVLNAGQEDTVRIIFFEGTDNLDDAEADHYAGLTFTPAPGTAVRDNAAHYTHVVTVTATAGTTGQVSVGFGHDDLADEFSFPAPYRVE